MASWSRDGVAGLQSVVLYSLPELDGAIDTVPLGGLVGDGIFLSLERVRKLATRIKRWVALRQTPAQVCCQDDDPAAREVDILTSCAPRAAKAAAESAPACPGALNGVAPGVSQVYGKAEAWS